MNSYTFQACPPCRSGAVVGLGLKVLLRENGIKPGLAQKSIRLHSLLLSFLTIGSLWAVNPLEFSVQASWFWLLPKCPITYHDYVGSRSCRGKAGESQFQSIMERVAGCMREPDLCNYFLFLSWNSESAVVPSPHALGDLPGLETWTFYLQVCFTSLRDFVFNGIQQKEGC